jgi:hypothetical protein
MAKLPVLAGLWWRGCEAYPPLWGPLHGSLLSFTVFPKVLLKNLRLEIPGQGGGAWAPRKASQNEEPSVTTGE